MAIFQNQGEQFFLQQFDIMNNQQIDKIINFFRINYQFHDPYRILLDGNFIKLVVEKGIDLSRRLETATKGRVSLRVTSCIIRELELLGEEFRLVVDEARKYKTIACKHSLEYSVDYCILDQIGETNQKLLMICSQDIELRRHLRTLQNVPIFYFGPDQRITMEDIPKHSLKQMQKQIQQKFLPNEKELALVNQLKQQQKQLQKKKEIKLLSSQQGIQIKTKIAKGPNPLSVKRKQRKDGSKPHEASSQVPLKQKRIRKRNKNPSNHSPGIVNPLSR